jgi:hypothetical protein
MAKRSLQKNSSKLNLTDSQSTLFQKIILAGNDMADALKVLEYRKLLPRQFFDLSQQWAKLMGELVNILI